MRNNFSNQKGNVLLIVLLLVFVLAILGASAYALSSNHGLLAQRNIDYDNAFQHAEQVENQYLWLFNRDPDILKNTSSYSYVDSPAASPVKRIYTPVNSTDSQYYRVRVEIPYDINAVTPTLVTNRAIVKVTAWPPNHLSSKRTIEAELVKKTFAENGENSNSPLNKSGGPVYWDSNESFYGSFHSNSSIYISGSPVFYGPVSYYTSIIGASPSNSSIFRQGTAKVSEQLEWPESNSKLMQEARIGGGFYNKGRTCIMLHDNGTYDIRYWDANAGTWKYNGVPYTYTPSSLFGALDDKGTFTTPTTTPAHTYSSFQNLRSTISSLDLPADGVIYIDGDNPIPNNDSLLGYSTTTGYKNPHGKFSPQYGNAFISGYLKGRLTIGAKNDIFVTAYDPTDWRDPWLYNTGLIPLFRPTFFGGFTRPSGLTYSTTDYDPVPNWVNWNSTTVSGNDMLGLVAQHDIRIMHSSWPAQIKELSSYTITCSNYSWGLPYDFDLGIVDDSSTKDIQIDAALFCVEGDMGYEKFDSTLTYNGTFTLFGSLSQNTTGNIADKGPFVSSYVRNYIQDPRMKTTSPPYFLEPANSGWQVASWAETKQHL